MIVKNEADTIGNCLDSVKDIVDEIIIVDTGSTDQTKEIVNNYTDLVFDFQWGDDFAAARNYSFSQATKEYIFWLDADDVLLATDQEKLIHLKETLNSSVDSVTMIYHYAFDQYGNPTKSFRRNRLVKRNSQFQWIGPVHEYLAVNGNIINSDITVTHKRNPQSGRNLAIFEKRLEKGETFTPRDLYYYANELYNHHFFQKAIDYYQQFLDTKQGWVEDEISTCNKLADIYYQLGDLNKEREYILKSFQYDTPRAEFCCRLGYQFLHNNEVKKATFWYKLATQLEKPEDNWGFFHEPCWTWLPHLQLCVCYYRLGEYERSYEHNEIARTFRPCDENILHNKTLLEKQLNNTKQKDIKASSLAPNESTKQKPTVHTVKRPLCIIQVAPDIYPIPPKKYGGIERVVYDLTEELIKKGHELYLYAPHGSQTSAKLIPYPHHGPNPNKIVEFVLKTLPAHIDLIHDHTHAAIIAQKNLSIPTIYTNHGGSKNEVKHPVYVSRRTLKVIGGNQGYYV